MAFCVYCGRKLEEGEVCNCRNVQMRQGVQGSQNVQAGQGVQSSQNSEGMEAAPQPGVGQTFGQNQGGYNQASQINMQSYEDNFNQVREVSGIYLKRLFGAFTGVLKKPAQCGKEFVASGETTLGIGFFAVQAILSGLFALIICSKLNSVLNVAAAWLEDESAKDLFSYPKAFLLTVLGSMIISFVIAGLLYLGIKIFKGRTTFGHMVCVVAVRAVGVCIFLMLSIVVTYLNVGWGILIFMVSWLVGLIFMIPVVQYGVDVDTNWLPYIAIIVALLSIVVFCVWTRISFPIYVSELQEQIDMYVSELQEQIEYFLNGLESLEDLGSLFF